MADKPVSAVQTLVGEGPALLQLHDDGVAHIRLNRPESANGLNVELLKALHSEAPLSLPNLDEADDVEAQ